MDASRDHQQNRRLDPVAKRNILKFPDLDPYDPNTILSEVPIEPNAYLDLPFDPNSIEIVESQELLEVSIYERLIEDFKSVARQKGEFDLCMELSYEEEELGWTLGSNLILISKLPQRSIEITIWLLIFIVNAILLSRGFEPIVAGIDSTTIPGLNITIKEKDAAFILAGSLGLMTEMMISKFLFVKFSVFRYLSQKSIARQEKYSNAISTRSIYAVYLEQQIDLFKQLTAEKLRARMEFFDWICLLCIVVGLSVDFIAVIRIVSGQISEGGDGANSSIDWSQVQLDDHLTALVSVVMVVMAAGLLGRFLYLPKAQNKVADRFKEYSKRISAFRLRSDIKRSNHLLQRLRSRIQTSEIDIQIIYLRHEIEFLYETLNSEQSNLYTRKIRVSAYPMQNPEQTNLLREALVVQSKMRTRTLKNEIQKLKDEMDLLYERASSSPTLPLL
jgi:hypothetical protein